MLLYLSKTSYEVWTLMSIIDIATNVQTVVLELQIMDLSIFIYFLFYSKIRISMILHVTIINCHMAWLGISMTWYHTLVTIILSHKSCATMKYGRRS